MWRKFREAWQRPYIVWQLLIWFLLIDFTAESILIYVSYYNARTTLTNEIENNLNAIASRQANQISQYLRDKENVIQELAQLSDIVEAAERYSKISAPSAKEVSMKPSPLATARARDSLLLRDMNYYLRAFHYDDILLVSASGRLLLSATERPEQDKHLRLDTDLRNSELGKVFERAITYMQTQVSDFTFYAESREATAFIATPIFKDKFIIGVLIARINNQEISRIVNDYNGLGQTGETEIFSRIGDEIVFITNIRNEQNKQLKTLPFAPRYQAETQALRGKRGFGEVKDYRDKDVLALWSYIPILRSGLVVKIDRAEAYAPIEQLRQILTLIILATLALVILAAIGVARTFTHPLAILTKFAKSLAQGDLSQRVHLPQRNEIGTLALTFNLMAENLQQKTQELEDYNKRLEDIVDERTFQLTESNEELKQVNEELQQTVEIVNNQMREIARINDDLVSSLNYAQRIQQAILPTPEEFGQILPDSFVLFKPRDIVSGDFYFLRRVEHKIILAVVDCTGHGVPGAFMSMIGNEFLNEIITLKGINRAHEILKELHLSVRHALRQATNQNRDGMDMALCVIDPLEGFVEFAGAKNPLVYIQQGQLFHLKGDKMPIGGWQPEIERVFTPHHISLRDADGEPITTNLYLFTDGYTDQFGGSDGRKFMIGQLKKMLLDISDKSMTEQAVFLERKFLQWRGKEKQLDDVCVVGIKI